MTVKGAPGQQQAYKSDDDLDFEIPAEIFAMKVRGLLTEAVLTGR